MLQIIPPGIKIFIAVTVAFLFLCHKWVYEDGFDLREADDALLLMAGAFLLAGVLGAVQDVYIWTQDSRSLPVLQIVLVSLLFTMAWMPMLAGAYTVGVKAFEIFRSPKSHR